MFIPIEISKKRCKPRKKGKFAIEINEQGRSAYYVRKLKYFLKEKYPFLKEECSLLREKSLKAAKPGDFIVFGIGKKYDYTVMSVESYLEEPAFGDKSLIIDLEAGFKLVKKTIRRYVQKNYPWELPTKKKCCSQQQVHAVLSTTKRPVAVRPVRIETVRQPVRYVRSKPRPRLADWDVTVNNTYVLLTNGCRYETRKITRCGNRETVSIDGNRYTVRRDYAGQGILV